MLADTILALRATRPRPILDRFLSPSSGLCLCPSARRSVHNTPALHSGSNRWSKIRHKKAANDASKGDAYANPELNARLAGLIRKARDLDVPKDKVEATLAKARDQGEQGSTVVYEVLGPAPLRGSQPVALVVECSTNSPTRTHAKMKEALNRSGGHRLSSTSHLFTKTGLVRVGLQEGQSFDELFDAALEEGAEEVQEAEDGEGEEGEKIVEIHCSPSSIKPLLKHLQTAPHAYTILSAEQAMLPSGSRVRLLGDDEASGGDDGGVEPPEDPSIGGYVDDAYVERLEKLAETLEEGADCQRIWSNLEGWTWPPR